MVDFNNETTVGTPAVDIVRILILQAQSYVFDALEEYNKQKDLGTDMGLSTIKARLFTWHLWMKPGIIRRYNNKKITYLEEKLNSEKEEDIFEAINFLNEELDKINITRVDFKKQFDRTRVEEENHHAGI